MICNNLLLLIKLSAMHQHLFTLDYYTEDTIEGGMDSHKEYPILVCADPKCSVTRDAIGWKEEYYED